MDLEKEAIKRLQYAEEVAYKFYDAPPLLAYSGGKDSDVLLELARRSGIEFEVQHSHTTADAPETFYHVREVFRQLELEGIKCAINYPHHKGRRTSLWQLVADKGIPPTRIARYCCDVCKEQAGKNRVLLTGVRWDESRRRSSERGMLEHNNPKKERRFNFTDDNNESRREFEACPIRGKTTINPIVDWLNYSLVQFHDSEVSSKNPVYAMGFNRAGCVGCPMAGNNRWAEFRAWPTYERAWRRAFAGMLETRKARGMDIDPSRPTAWIDVAAVFDWWMEDKNLEGQMELKDYT